MDTDDDLKVQIIVHDIAPRSFILWEQRRPAICQRRVLGTSHLFQLICELLLDRLMIKISRHFNVDYNLIIETSSGSVRRVRVDYQTMKIGRLDKFNYNRH